MGEYFSGFISPKEMQAAPRRMLVSGVLCVCFIVGGIVLGRVFQPDEHLPKCVVCLMLFGACCCGYVCWDASIGWRATFQNPVTTSAGTPLLFLMAFLFFLSMGIIEGWEYYSAKNRKMNVKLWDVTSGKLNITLTGYSLSEKPHIDSVAYSPDGKILAAGG